MKLKKNNKFIVAADGAAASGKTTGSKIILSTPWLNLKIPLVTFSKHSLSVCAFALTE